jgi:hypothetical protein
MNTSQPTLHSLDVTLTPNHHASFDGKEKGAYLARIDCDKRLTVRQVCEQMKERGRFNMDGDQSEYVVNAFLDECAYNLCDGFELDFKYFAVRPRITGSFSSPDDVRERGIARFDFAFRILSPLRRLFDKITLNLRGARKENASLDEVNTGYYDEAATILCGATLYLRGHNIKVEGNNSACGIYIVYKDPNGAEKDAVKLEADLIQNTRTSIIVNVPALPESDNATIRIVTQHSGGGKPLETPHLIEYRGWIAIRGCVTPDPGTA